MKRIFVLLIFLLSVSAASAGPFFSSGGSGGGAAVTVYTVATLPGSPPDGTVYAITDGNDAADCTVGTGAFLNLCIYDDGGSAYVIAGDGAGTGNSFSTHDAPAGTDPAASGTDTLTWLDTAPIVITGDSAADSMTISVNTATTTSEGVSEWATDAEAVALTADRVVVASSLDNVLAAPPAIGGTTAGAVTGSTVTSEGSFVIGLADMNEADLEKLDEITNGTQAANKAVVADANVNTGISKVTQLHIGTSGSEVQVTSTPAELNLLDTVTTTATQFNYLNIADGLTGTGSVVLDDTPTLITPVLGAATGTSLAASGVVSSGTDDTTAGSFLIYGGSGSAAGGYLDIYNSADDDAVGVQDFWRIRAAGTNLQVGIEGALTTSSAFIFNADGSINKSPTPKIIFDDTDGADGYIDLNADDANSAVMTIGVDDVTPADDVPYIELDGVNQRVEIKKPLDAGKMVETITASEDFNSTEADTGSKFFYFGSAAAADVVITLNPSGLTDGGASRTYNFYNGTGNDDVWFDPVAAGDIVVLAGTGSCGSDKALICDPNASGTIRGVSAGVWVAVDINGTCACES